MYACHPGEAADTAQGGWPLCCVHWIMWTFRNAVASSSSIYFHMTKFLHRESYSYEPKVLCLSTAMCGTRKSFSVSLPSIIPGIISIQISCGEYVILVLTIFSNMNTKKKTSSLECDCKKTFSLRREQGEDT